MHRKSSKIQKVPLDSNLLMKKNHPISDYNIFHLTTSTGMNTSPKQSGTQSRWITDFESCPNSQLLCGNSLSHYQFPLPHKPEEKWRQACHHRSNHVLTQVQQEGMESINIKHFTIVPDKFIVEFLLKRRKCWQHSIKSNSLLYLFDVSINILYGNQYYSWTCSLISAHFTYFGKHFAHFFFIWLPKEDNTTEQLIIVGYNLNVKINNEINCIFFYDPC